MRLLPKIKPLASDYGAPWRVDISARASMSGKRERHFFKTKIAAQGFADEQNARLMRQGTGFFDLTPEQRVVAQRAFELIGFDKEPGKLLDLVRSGLERERISSQSIQLGMLFAWWVAHLRKKTRRGRKLSRRYFEGIRQAKAKFAPLLEISVAELKPAEIKAVIQDCPGPSRNAYLRVLKAVINFAIHEDLAKENPVKKVAMADLGEQEVEIFTPLQTAKLLLAAKRFNDPGLLAYFLFGFFAGIRPEELLRVRWEFVKLSENHIYMPAEITKTGFRRYIEIEPNLAAWIAWIEATHGKQKGLLLPEGNPKKRVLKARKAAHIKYWPQDGKRHSYASYWMAAHRNEDRCRDNMGHRTKDELQKHYRKHVPARVAERFWKILPKKRR